MAAKRPRSERQDHIGLVSPAATRFTGAVDILIDGSLPVRTGKEILAIAKKTRFNEAGAFERKYSNGSLRYVPPIGTKKPMRNAFPEGLLLYKMIVDRKAPDHINLDPGTYYFFMQFVNGRWIGVAVDLRGRVACTSYGLIARELFTVHIGERHISTSKVIGHSITVPSDVAKLGAAADDGWVDVQINWEPFGAGCWKDIVCVPGT